MERAFPRRVAVCAAMGLSAAVTAAAGMHGRRNALNQTNKQRLHLLFVRWLVLAIVNATKA